MDQRLMRPGFGRLDRAEKEALMAALARQYDLTFLGLADFDRWGQRNTTGVFEQAGRTLVFVPGDTVTLGWESFAVGLDEATEAEISEALAEFAYEGSIEEFLRLSMTPVRQAVIGPMLVSRYLEEIGWENVAWDAPILAAHPDWLKEWQAFAARGGNGLNINQQVRFTRTNDGWQAALYHDLSYTELMQMLARQGLSLPTNDEWEYLCGGGCRTLFPWGDSFDYDMHLYHFEERGDERPYTMEEANFFGLSIAYDPYKRELVQAEAPTFKGGDGGCNICGGLGPVLGYLPCSPYYQSYQSEDEADMALDGDFDFIRPIIRLS